MKYNPPFPAIQSLVNRESVKRREYDENKQRNNPEAESFVSGNS